MGALTVAPQDPRPAHPRLVVLDYSGTLSLGAVLFGSAENLQRELRASGLERLGVISTAFFWDELVNPTWEEGSTTRRGYRRVLYDRLRQIFSWPEDHPMAREATVAAERFVGSYLRHATIDPAWRSVIAGVLERGDTVVIVATDHYAEFTDHIVAELRALGLAAAPALRADADCRLLVANSADLGWHKATPGFWERLKEIGHPVTASVVVLVDDLGLNEQPMDAYAAPAKAKQRLKDSVQLLRRAYAARVAAFSFFLDHGPDARGEALQGQFRALIERAEAFIRSEFETP